MELGFDPILHLNFCSGPYQLITRAVFGLRAQVPHPCSKGIFGQRVK